MNLLEEISALKTVIETLTPLQKESQQRVIEYAKNALELHSERGASHFTPLTQQIPTNRASSDKPLSPQEYLRKYSYKIMTKRIAVMAVFLERERNLKRFSLKDITEVFRDAKEAKTPAHSQYVRAVAMNYLAKEGDLYYATTKAENLVDSFENQAGDDGEKS